MATAPPLRALDARRCLDVVGAPVALVVASPVLAIVALAIWCVDGCPVLYRAPRVGRNGSEFRMLKFRTMAVGAEAGGSITTADDERVTRLGRVLRRYKLDELPQLINVIRGEMSLVGPRPEVAEYVERYSDDQRRLLEQRPGITGVASLAFRDEEYQLRSVPGDELEEYYLKVLMPRKLALELRYMEERTIGSDVRIVVETLLSAVRSPRRG